MTNLEECSIINRMPYKIFYIKLSFQRGGLWEINPSTWKFWHNVHKCVSNQIKRVYLTLRDRYLPHLERVGPKQRAKPPLVLPYHLPLLSPPHPKYTYTMLMDFIPTQRMLNIWNDYSWCLTRVMLCFFHIKVETENWKDGLMMEVRCCSITSSGWPGYEPQAPS